MGKENSCSSNNSFDDWRVDDTCNTNSRGNNKNKKPLSKGISPERFHSHHHRIQSDPVRQSGSKQSAGKDDRGIQKLGEIKEMVHSNLVQIGKRRIGREQALRRAAYKQLTECKTWPLQEPALQHFHRLMQHHCNITATDDHHNVLQQQHCGGTNPYSKNKHHQSLHKPNHPSAKSAVILTGSLPLMTSQQSLTCPGASSSSSVSSPSCSDMSSLHNEESKRLMRTFPSSPAKNRYKELCRQGFLREQAIPRGLTFPTSRTKALENKTVKEESSPSEEPSDLEWLMNGHALWSMEPCIWAWEISATGKRKYVVGHLGRCMELYWQKTLAENRHGYELIRENIPCRLYLDIEYSKPDNPHLTEEEASKEFLNALYHDLSKQLQEKYPDHCSRTSVLKRKHIVDLDSSTDKKFSRHWIVHLPGHELFSSSRAVGCFVHEWIGSLMEKHAHITQQLAKTTPDQLETKSNLLDPALLKYLMVNTKPHVNKKDRDSIGASSSSAPPQTCIVDLGVYTKNRLFRLLGSCKYGKPASAALRIAEENEFPFAPKFGNDNFYKAAANPQTTSSVNQQASVTKAKKKYDYDVPELEEVLQYKTTIDWGPHADVLAQTLVIPVNSSKIVFPILPDLPGGNGWYPRGGMHNNSSQSGQPAGLHYAPQSSGPSPLPLLDQFVLTYLATRGGVQGTIRSWTLESRAQDETPSPLVLATYFLNRNRYCQHIRRQHKSNGIFWVVDFVTGKAAQRCFDPDCRGFISQPVLLPIYVRDHIREYTSKCEPSSSSSSSSRDVKLTETVRNHVHDEQQQDDDALSEAIQSLRLEEERSIATTISTVAEEDTPPPTTNSSENNTDASSILNSMVVVDTLSDDAILEAMMANPELFP
ncbi:hypothetical protein ACA910_022433 [Epithemia clementina (nom. ined.)]